MMTRGTYCNPLSSLRKNFFRGLLVPTALYQNIQHVVVLIDGSLRVMAFTIDGEKHLIKVPLVPWLGASTLQLIRVVLPKFQTPLADGFMSDVDPAFEQQFLHVAVTQREAIIEPDAMADDLAGTAVIFVALRVSRWCCVWLPIGGSGGS